MGRSEGWLLIMAFKGHWTIMKVGPFNYFHFRPLKNVHSAMVHLGPTPYRSKLAWEEQVFKEISLEYNQEAKNKGEKKRRGEHIFYGF